MTIYDQFAPIYQRGPYVRFSQNFADAVLPEFLEDLNFQPKDLLDMACGEGSFAVTMATQGYQVTGIDQSQRMIDLAIERARAANVEVDFLVEDMCDLPFRHTFDLVTCLFDSMNYLLTVKALHDAIQSAYTALRPGGYFIFDMNTIYGLAVDWMREKTTIQNEADDFIEIHRQDFDYENLVANLEITIFQRCGDLWNRIDETHRERGYPIADLQFLLSETGFEIVGMYGSLSKRSVVQTTSARVWFTARKPA